MLTFVFFAIFGAILGGNMVIGGTRFHITSADYALAFLLGMLGLLVGGLLGYFVAAILGSFLPCEEQQTEQKVQGWRVTGNGSELKYVLFFLNEEKLLVIPMSSTAVRYTGTPTTLITQKYVFLHSLSKWFGIEPSDTYILYLPKDTVQ